VRLGAHEKKGDKADASDEGHNISNGALHPPVLTCALLVPELFFTR
jgi:hypothetical protein